MDNYNEADAIKAMRNVLTPEKQAAYDDDELTGVLDMIFDWYEENGFLEIDFDDDREVDAQALGKYVRDMLKADKNGVISPEDAQALVDAELAYEESLDED